ncbi:cell division protein FtsQ/DivIB [Enterococcus hailinensis]|uniref:cell division protein FtsQ/DivIB n=1 Tax=Enterococcus hailinensis TaxID=3238988 RepID=UPI0038B28D34
MGVKIISRKEFPEEPNESQKPAEPEILTPWQLANMEYMKQKALENKEAQPEESLSESEKDEAAADDLPTEPEKESENVAAIKEKNTASEDPEPEEIPSEEVKLPSGPRNGSFLDRLPNIRHERNRLLVRRSSILIGLFAIPALFLLYYISPLADLGAVTIKGNEHVATETIKQELDFNIGGNLWSQFFGRNDNVKQLKKQELQIEDATVRIDGFNHFAVTIKEYAEVAYLESNGKYSPVISSGKVIPIEVEKSDGSLPILESFTNSKRILHVLDQYKKLSEEVKQGISQIKYAPTSENKELLEILMNDGNKVLVSIDDLGKKMNYYPQVVEQMNEKEIKGVVDMEAGIYSYPYEDNSSEADTTQSTTNQSETTEAQ